MVLTHVMVFTYFILLTRVKSWKGLALRLLVNNKFPDDTIVDDNRVLDIIWVQLVRFPDPLASWGT